MSLDEHFLPELARVASTVATAMEPTGHDELLQAVTDAAKDLFKAAACSLALLTEHDEALEYRVASGAGAEEVLGMRVPVGRGVAGWVVSSGMPISVDDVGADPRFARDVAERTGYVPRSILAMPLETERAVLGVISVLDRAPATDAAAAQWEMATLALFARQAALAIEGARMFSDAGRILLRAVATAAESQNLATALERAAEGPASRPDRELIDIAALFTSLGRADPDARSVAVAILGELVRYAESQARRR